MQCSTVRSGNQNSPLPCLSACLSIYTHTRYGDEAYFYNPQFLKKEKSGTKMELTLPHPTKHTRTPCVPIFFFPLFFFFCLLLVPLPLAHSDAPMHDPRARARKCLCLFLVMSYDEMEKSKVTPFGPFSLPTYIYSHLTHTPFSA